MMMVGFFLCDFLLPYHATSPCAVLVWLVEPELFEVCTGMGIAYSTGVMSQLGANIYVAATRTLAQICEHGRDRKEEEMYLHISLVVAGKVINNHQEKPVKSCKGVCDDMELEWCVNISCGMFLIHPEFWNCQPPVNLCKAQVVVALVLKLFSAYLFFVPRCVLNVTWMHFG